MSDASHDLVTADDPICKKTKLDFERVIMGEKLSDLDINAAQRILKQQFPNVNGLDSTLYQIKERKLTENQVKKQNTNYTLPTQGTLDCCHHCRM